MNKEEILNKYIDLIDKGYCSDCNELNCIDNFPHAKITHAIRELQQENQELKEELVSANESITWWNNRFNAVTRDNEQLKQENKKYKEVIDKANKLLKEKVKVIPFDENGEGGGLELTDYDIQDLLDILKEVSE